MIDILNKYGTVLFFSLFLLLGLWITPDYGMSWDEDAQVRHGIISMDYVGELLFKDYQKTLPEYTLETYKDRTYGVLFSMTALGLEKIMALDNYRTKMLLRHYLVFILFWAACISFFKLIRFGFKDKIYAFLGVSLLLLSPRIFANAFYNTKDIVLLSMMIISTYTLVKFIGKRTWKTTLIHALACATVINTRILGILIPALTLFLLVAWIGQQLLHKKSIFIKNEVLKTGIWIVVTIFLTIAFCPYLWEAPFTRFAEIFTEMSKYPWEGTNLFMGMRFKGTEVPWYYIPGWIAVTSPLIYVALGLIAVLYFPLRIWKRLTKKNVLWNNHFELVELIAWGLFIVPILIIILKNSVLYNGWRQVYFLYPFLLLVILAFLKSWESAWDKNLIRFIPFAFLTVQMFIELSFIIKNHPYQMTYFSVIAGDNHSQRYEMDYWGLSYKQAFEKLAAKHPKETIKVKTSNYPGWQNFLFLPSHYHKYLHHREDISEADYFMSNFYNKEEHHKYTKRIAPYNLPIEFAIKVEADTIMVVYKNINKIK